MAVNKNKIVAQAQRYSQKGQFEKAIAEYRKLITSDPTDIRTWLKMGDLYTRMGARKEATETYFRVAEQYTKSGFHLKAIAVYKQVLNLDPTLVIIHKYLAVSYVELGLTSEALIQLEQLADVYQRTGKRELLLETLLQMGNIDPHNIATRLRIAELLSEEKRIKEATKHFAIACEELKKQGREDDYIKVAARLFYHDPSRVDIAQEIAEVYIEREQYKEALSKLQACFLKNPKDVQILDLLALAFKGLEQPEKAISVYEEMYGLLTDRNKRREVLDEILELNPEHSKAQAWLKEGSRMSREPFNEDSISTAIRAEFPDGEIPDGELPAPGSAGDTEQQPEEAIQNRSKEILEEAKVLLKYGVKERALDHLEKIYEFDPYNIDARELNKDVLLEMNKREEALEHLFLLADVFKDTQPEGSVYYLHEILRVDPTNLRAKNMIIDLGGIMPEGLDDGPSPEDEAVLLLEAEEDIVLIDDSDLQAADELMADEVDDWRESEPPAITITEEAEEVEEVVVVEETEPPLVDEEVNMVATKSENLPIIDDDLEEIEFFISQELYEEARGLLDELMESHPTDPRLKNLNDQLLKATRGQAEAETDDDDDGPIVEVAEDTTIDGSVQFKNVGLQERISPSDAATNWDLGLAYKEMGLFEDAIHAFGIAARDPARAGSAKTMIGVCLASLNKMDEAVNVFEEGLTEEIADPQQKMGLLYELGKTYQQMNRPSEALRCFQKIFKIDKGFADIRSRIASLAGGKKRPATA